MAWNVTISDKGIERTAQRPLSDFPCPNEKPVSPFFDIFGLGLDTGCHCPDCWLSSARHCTGHDDENIRAEMRQAGAMRRRADAELLAVGITEFVSRAPLTGEQYLLKMGERGTFSLSGEEKARRIQLEKTDAN